MLFLGVDPPPFGSLLSVRNTICGEAILSSSSIELFKLRTYHVIFHFLASRLERSSAMKPGCIVSSETCATLLGFCGSRSAMVMFVISLRFHNASPLSDVTTEPELFFGHEIVVLFNFLRSPCDTVHRIVVYLAVDNRD